MNISKDLRDVCNKDQQLLIQKKYASPKIGKLSQVEFIKFSETFMILIYVITGWTLPTGKIMDVLTNQFQKKLIEDYSDLNVDEIEYAFRRITNIEDWGKELNLSLIDKVLKPYKDERFEVSEVERRSKETPVQKIYSDADILNERRKEIEIAFQAMKRGYFPIIHRYFSEVLIEDGFIKEEKEMSAFFSKSIATVEKLYEKQ